MNVCTIDGCARAAKYARIGLCGTHYERQRLHGSVEDPRVPDEERFWAQVDPTGCCWWWTGATHHQGYGQTRFDGTRNIAHRVAYELLVGPIPEGLVIDHLCRNRACVNPDHLEPVTIAENTRRGHSLSAQRARQVTCVAGHPLVELPGGRRGCPTCKATWKRQWRANRQAVSV